MKPKGWIEDRHRKTAWGALRWTHMMNTKQWGMIINREAVQK